MGDPSDGPGYIAMLAVEKELRGQRIGSKLVQLCLDRMRREGAGKRRETLTFATWGYVLFLFIFEILNILFCTSYPFLGDFPIPIVLQTPP